MPSPVPKPATELTSGNWLVFVTGIVDVPAGNVMGRCPDGLTLPVSTAGRTPNIQRDILADEVQNQVQNVIVQDVNITYGPWVENRGGGLETESHIIGQSSKAFIFRNVRMITGTWSVGATGSATKFLDSSGHVIPLQPGRTWVEIYPVGASQVVTPATPPTTTAAKSAG
jgi:hypothetical protein